MTLLKDYKRNIISLWELIIEELKGIKNRVQPEKYYGIVWYPTDWENRGYFYMAAMEIESPDLSNPALVVKTLPAFNYTRFDKYNPR